MAYTIQDARREIRQCIEEGYDFDFIRIFINNLARDEDITWIEARKLMRELIDGEFGEIECTFRTF